MKEVSHEIDLKADARIPRIPPYRRTPKEEDQIVTIVNDLLKKGFIEPSKSPYSSPVVLVKKKDGSFRLCVDYRVLNEATIKDPFPLPRIEVLLAKIGNASIFSTLDLHSGYHQIPVKPEDVPKTAFTTHNGKYQYRVMPFGLVNAPSTFSRYMADIFRDLPFVLVYLDDILVISTSEKQHIEHLNTVLGRLQEHQLIAKEKKCQFLQTEVEFLGYHISEHCIRPIKGKCDAIHAIPPCKSIKDAQRFLGMINYYRRFIPHCSTIARPLIDYAAKKTPWTTLQTNAFNELKRLLVAAPLLVPFCTEHSYRLTTDASKSGLGAVLEQMEGKKVVGVVGYFSKSLQGAQNNYPAGELELLGIIESLRHFKYLLHGKRFTLRTDHISLLALKNKAEPSNSVLCYGTHLYAGGRAHLF